MAVHRWVSATRVIARRNVHTEIGATEHDAGARGGRMQGEVDPLAGMQADSDAGNGGFQRALTADDRGGLQRFGQSIHARVLCPRIRCC